VCVVYYYIHVYIFVFSPFQLINDYDKLGIQVLLAAPARENIVHVLYMSILLISLTIHLSFIVPLFVN